MAAHKPPVTLNPTWRLFTLDRWRVVRKVSARAPPDDRSKGTRSPFSLPAALTPSKEPIHHHPLGLTIPSPDSLSPASLTLSLWLRKWNKCPLESHTNPPSLFHSIHSCLCAHLWLCCSCQKENAWHVRCLEIQQALNYKLTWCAATCVIQVHCGTLTVSLPFSLLQDPPQSWQEC